MARGLVMRGRSHSLPVIHVPTAMRTVEYRRNALGNIFQGQKAREITKFTAGKKFFVRSMSTVGDSVTPVGHSIRFNLTSGDFELHDELFDHAEDESQASDELRTSGGDYPTLSERELNLDTSVSGDNDINHSGNSSDQSHYTTRRLALADIFANVEQDLLLELLAVYSGADVNEIGLYKRVRRNGLGDVYADINETDLKMFLTEFEGQNVNGYITDDNSNSSSDETDEEMEEMISYRRNRRHALANIFDGMEKDTVVSIAGERDAIEDEAKEFDYQSRRMALPNIKNIVSKEDMSRLNNMYNESEINSEQCVRSRQRRSAMANIYSGLDSEELNSFLGHFSESVDSDTE